VLGTVATVAAGLSHASAQSPLSLWIDPTTTTLSQNASGQIVRVLIQNTGAPFPVVGGTFYFQIDDGDTNTGPAPVITGVNLTGIPGNPFTSANILQSTTSTVGEYWEEFFTTLPDPTTPWDPLSPVNLTGLATYTFAEVTIDTTGFNTLGQSWDFKIQIPGLVPSDPYFDIEVSGSPPIQEHYPQATNGTIQIGVVPIPEATLPAGGAGVLGFALLSSVWRRRISALRKGPG